MYLLEKDLRFHQSQMQSVQLEGLKYLVIVAVHALLSRPRSSDCLHLGKWRLEKKNGQDMIVSPDRQYQYNGSRLQQVDLSIPVILCPLGVFDGRHRIAKAIKLGKPFLDAFTITTEEMKECLLSNFQGKSA